MIIEKRFPNFTSRAITFTIDDGNIALDSKLIEIVKPAGIKGTFNLCLGSTRPLSDEQYREIYDGFEIANHCFRHPFSFDPEKDYNFAEDIFDAEKADKEKVYKTEKDGIYRIFHRSYWGTIAENRAYAELAEESRITLENIFGKGSIKGFVWPYGKTRNKELWSMMASAGYTSMRNGSVADFSLPGDRMNWNSTASYMNLEERMQEFLESGTDSLKFFCFGLHSSDFEKSGKWEELQDFAAKYGNRPSDFWYAGVNEIFEYEDAVNSIEICDHGIKNPSEKTVYIIADGVKYILAPGECVKI